MCSLALELVVMPSRIGGQDEHFACFTQFPQFSLNLRLPWSASRSASLPQPSYPRPLSLSSCLLFVVILLRKIAHPFGLNGFGSALRADLLRSGSKGDFCRTHTATMRAVSNELRPNTWRNLKTSSISQLSSLSPPALPGLGNYVAQPEAVNLPRRVQRLPPPTCPTHGPPGLAPLSIFGIQIRKYLT